MRNELFSVLLEILKIFHSKFCFRPKKRMKKIRFIDLLMQKIVDS